MSKAAWTSGIIAVVKQNKRHYLQLQTNGNLYVGVTVKTAEAIAKRLGLQIAPGLGINEANVIYAG